MRLLARHRPRLIGSVMTGHIRAGSDIDLHVFSDSIEAVTSILDENGMVYDVEHKRVRKDGEERVFTHVHVKDRKMHNGGNTQFGEGDTPIGEVLRLIRDKHWDIQATIEFEYKVPAGSDRMTELGRTIRYCRDALV